MRGHADHGTGQEVIMVLSRPLIILWGGVYLLYLAVIRAYILA